jgi:hypothetical protein
MFQRSKIKIRKKRQTSHPAFNEIQNSCTRELLAKGFETQVYLLAGGVGVKLLNDNHPSLAQIAHLPIIEFDFDYPGEPPLEHLAFFPIQGLRLSQSSLKNFAQLEQFTLKKLHLDGINATDFNSLSIHQLEELSLRKTQVKSLDFLDSAPIQNLYLSRTPVNDKSLNSLKGKPLEVVDLFKCEIADLSVFSDSPLDELIISGTSVRSLSPISSCPIRKLEMRATNINDLSPLSNCPIEILLLPGSPVKSLSSVRSCPIRELNIVGLDLDDLSPLLDMPLKKLTISKNELTEEQIMILKQLELDSLMSPGDPDDQQPDDFFQAIRDS